MTMTQPKHRRPVPFAPWSWSLIWLAGAWLLLLPHEVQAVPNCGGKTAQASCGRSNFCYCCSGTCSNCVWWAWEAACRNWRFAFATCNDAHRWNEQAKGRGEPTGKSPRSSSVFVCERGGACSQWGHVGWVVTAHANGSFSTTEQSCSGPCTTTSKTRPAGYATGGFIYNPKGDPPPTLTAKFVSQSTSAMGGSGGAQHSLCPGQGFTFNFKLKNTGNINWTDVNKKSAGRAVRLGFRKGTSFGAPSRVSVNDTSNKDVKPGESVTFNMKGTAPTKGGVYKTEWQLVSELITWFGPNVWLSFNVTSKPPGYGKDCELKSQSGECSKGVMKCTSKGLACVGATASEEVCDNKDNDCNGLIDDGLEKPCYQGPSGTQDVGRCRSGTQTCTAGAWSPCVGEILPASEEICGNTIDDDCDGQIDEDCKDTSCVDNDGDGYGVGNGCTGEQDCDDNDKTIYPGAPEICDNGKDDDCRGGDRSCTPQQPVGTVGCTKDADCLDQLCAQIGSIKRCSKSCLDDADCPSSFMCINQMCWPYENSARPPTNPTTPSNPSDPSVPTIPTPAQEGGSCANGGACVSGTHCVNGMCAKISGRGCQIGSQPSLPGLLLLGLLLLLPGVGIRRKRR